MVMDAVRILNGEGKRDLNLARLKDPFIVLYRTDNRRDHISKVADYKMKLAAFKDGPGYRRRLNRQTAVRKVFRVKICE